MKNLSAAEISTVIQERIGDLDFDTKLKTRASCFR